MSKTRRAKMQSIIKQIEEIKADVDRLWEEQGDYLYSLYNMSDAPEVVTMEAEQTSVFLGEASEALEAAAHYGGVVINGDRYFKMANLPQYDAFVDMFNIYQTEMEEDE